MGKWTKQKWRTIDGKPAKRGAVTRRYLPAKAWDNLTVGQRAATNRKKIKGSKRGERVVLNTRAAAKARQRAARGQKHIEFYDELDFKAVGKRISGGLAGRIGVGEVENRGRSARRAMGRIGAAVEPFDPKARDADSDGVVQEGTIHERPAIPGINPIGPAKKPSAPSVKPTERLAQRITENRVNLPRREAREDRVPRVISRGQEPEKKPSRVERAKPTTPRREAERVTERKPINTPKPAASEAAPKPQAVRQVEQVDSTTEKLQQAARKLGMEAERAQALKESYDDFSNQLDRQEKNKIYRAWQDGNYSIDELADQFDVVRDEIATVLRNHQDFRDENEKAFKKNNDKLASAVESRMGVSKEPILEAAREGKIRNWDSMLNWVFRSADSKKNNKNGELEADLFRAFPSGQSPEKDSSKFVLGIRETNRAKKRGYVRDIADAKNKPEGFRQLNEIQRTAQSAFDGSSSRWDTNERASNARFYRELSRDNDAGKMWDSSITGAMATGPNMTPQEESDWKRREWKRQQLKNLALIPDRDTKLPSLSSALVGDDIARAISGLDILSGDQVDDLFDKTSIELNDAGLAMQGYRAATAPPSPRELAAAANIKRPLVKEFLDEYKNVNPAGNISRLDPDAMSDKDIDNFFNTFIIPGLINANNPSNSDIRQSVREPLNSTTLSLAEDVAFGIADEYQDLEFRTMLAKRMLQDNGLSTSDPNFDKLVEQMINNEIDKDVANGIATIEDFLSNIPEWMDRTPEELLNPNTGMPYTHTEWSQGVSDSAQPFFDVTNRILDGEDVDPIEALAAQEKLSLFIDVGQSNGWLSNDVPRPEYPSRTRRIDNDDDGDDSGMDALNAEPPAEQPPGEQPPGEQPPDDGGGSVMDDNEGEINRQIEEFLNGIMNYGDEASRPKFEDKYGTLDTDEVWNQPIYDDAGNIIAPAYDGSDNHPFNLDIDGNPIDVTQLARLDNQLFRHWLSNGHFLREWTENYPGSQVDRYKNLDEMVDVAVPPKELEDAFYKGDINSLDPLAIDQSVASGLDKLIEIIAADEPQWFTRDANGELIGDLNEITKSGSYGSGGMPRMNLSADDYSASQTRTKLKEARDAAIKQEHDDLNSSNPASAARRAQLWNLFDSGTLSADEIAFDENLLDTQNLILALKRYSLENNISTQKYNDARRVADTAALSRADEFTKKRIQRIKDEFVAQGLEPKEWAKAIDKEIDKQKSLVDKIEIEYSRFRTAFSRQMILVREIFATRPPNREQQTLRDGTILPGWDKSKESASQYLNRIRRWDMLHLGTQEKRGPLGDLLTKMRFSAREDGRDAASGATARITALAKRNIDELQQLRNEYSRVKAQANQSGISGFMRLGGRDAEFYDTAKLSSRAAARQAAHGDFKFVPPNVLRRYDKAGLPISRAVRNSASGYNRNMAQEIADASRGSIKPVDENPGFKYLSPKLQQIARIVSNFADNTRDVKTSAKETFKKVRGQKRQAQPAFNPKDAEKLDISRARAYTSRLIDYKPKRLSGNAKRIYGGGISGAMQLYTEEFPDGNWYVVNELGHKLFPEGHRKQEDALRIANLYQTEKRGELPYAPTDQTMRTAARLGQRLGEYTGDRNFELDVADSITPWVLGNDSKPMQEAGDAVILRTNPETGEREILLIERLFGPHTAQTRSLSLPGGFRKAYEQLRDTAQREALEEVNVTDKDVVRMEHLGEIEDRDWDPRFVNGARISGVVLEVSPDTDVRAGDDASTAAWYSLERISDGVRPLAFGHAAWVALALAGTNDERLHDRFVNLNAISRRRQQRIISGVNAARKRISIETGQKLKLFPRPTENADSGYTAFGPDAELHMERIMKWAREKRNGGITGEMTMNGKYFRGPITSWSSDNLSKNERDKIMKDVIALRRKELNPIHIARSLNTKWEDDNFKRTDGGIHSFNPQQVKDVIYKARMDGVKFAKLRDEKPTTPVQSAENIKFIAQRSFVGGHSASDIANELDISANEVMKVQRAIGLSSIHAGKQKEKRNNESAKVVELVGNGKSFKEAATELGITEQVARNRYKSALSAGNITGSMNVNDVPFFKLIEMSKEGEELRKTNAEAFYSKTYERISNSEIAKTLGIKASEVNDAVQNHLDFIENNRNEILSTYEKAFQNSKKNLTAAENRHMKMRFDGMPIDKIAEIEGIDVLDALTSESLILAKLRGQNRNLFETKMSIKEQDLINAPIDSQRGLPKRIYVAVKHDGLDIEAIAKAEDITPAQARDNFKKYSDALEKTDNPNKQLLRRAVILNGSDLNDSHKQFIEMRLDGVSIRDMAHLNGTDVVEVKIDQTETMNRLDSGGITGAMGSTGQKYKDSEYYDVLGISQNASDKEVRAAYRKAARETHPDFHPGDRNNEALFGKIQEAYSVLSNQGLNNGADDRKNIEDVITPGTGILNPFNNRYDISPLDGGITGAIKTGDADSGVKKNSITYRGKRWKDKKVSIFEPILSFRSQVSQYPDSGPPGVSYFRGEDDDLRKKGWWVDALLYRDKDGKVLGILNHYPQDMPAEQRGGPSEKKGNVNIFIDPKNKRSGIASELLKEATARYKVDLNKQRYSKEGAAFVNSFIRSLPENNNSDNTSITGSMKARPSTSAAIKMEKRLAESKPRRWSDEEINDASVYGADINVGGGITGRMSDDATRKALEDLMRDANEPLDKDLEDFVEFNNEMGMPIVRHPLIMWIGPMMPGIINKQYRQKLDAVARAREERNWQSYIYLHERPYRLDAFMDVADDMSDNHYWENLADIWIDSENIWQNKDLWKSALSSKRPGKSNMMQQDELDELDALPDKIKIYRGYIKGKNQNGFSWTTDKDKAAWFSNRLARSNEKPLVAEATVSKKDVVAYFTRRGESEVVLSKMPNITGSMNVGASSESIKKRKEREDRVKKASSALDRLLSENPSKYKNLKNAAIAIHNEITSQNVKEETVADKPEGALEGFFMIENRGDSLVREASAIRGMKKHLLIRRIMGELMTDGSVDKDGKLKGSMGDHITDEKKIARKEFSESLQNLAESALKEVLPNFMKNRRKRKIELVDQEKIKKLVQEKLPLNNGEAMTPKTRQALILKLLNSGVDYSAIAERLDTTPQAIRQTVHRLGGLNREGVLRAKRVIRDEKVREFIKKNPQISSREIAKRFNVARKTVLRIRDNMDAPRDRVIQGSVDSQRKIVKDSIDESIEKMVRSGKTTGEIVKAVGMGRGGVYRRLKLLGLNTQAPTKDELDKRKRELTEFIKNNPKMTRLEISQATGVSLERVKNSLRNIGISAKPGSKKGTPSPKKGIPSRKKKGKTQVSGITGAMGLFDKFTNNEPPKPTPAPFVPKNLPKMDDSLAKRIGFKGKLTTYNPANYTSSRPSSTLNPFLAQKDEPFIGLDATFGGTTKIKEGRFWDLYQPIAVALSKAVTKNRKDGQPKRFISVGGPPGSGKSTLRFSGKHDIPLTDAAVHIDADEMKTLIPEAIEMHRNGNPSWGDASHEESRIMADVALKVGLENGHDVVYDSTGQFNSGFGTLKAARDKGYEIVAHYNVSPLSILEARIDEREKIDPRRLPRHIIPAVNVRNFKIMPEVAKASDEFYLWDTDVNTGQEPVLLARKIKGGNLEILDARAYAHGDFDPTGQAIDMSKPDFKMNPRKVARNSREGKIITDYENGKTVTEIATDRKTGIGNIFDAITKHEIDPSMPDITYTPPPPYQKLISPGSKPRVQELLSDSQAMNQFRNLSSSDKAVLRDFVAKKPGVTLDDMTERIPMDLVIWAAKQKPEHTQPLGQIRSIEKLENLSPGKRQQLTEMLQAGETVVEIANALNLPFSVIDVAMDFVDQYGYIPEGGDTEEKTAVFDNVFSNRLGRMVGKTIKASMLNGVVINER